MAFLYLPYIQEGNRSTSAQLGHARSRLNGNVLELVLLLFQKSSSFRTRGVITR